MTSWIYFFVSRWHLSKSKHLYTLQNSTTNQSECDLKEPDDKTLHSYEGRQWMDGDQWVHNLTESTYLYAQIIYEYTGGYSFTVRIVIFIS